MKRKGSESTSSMTEECSAKRAKTEDATKIETEAAQGTKDGILGEEVTTTNAGSLSENPAQGSKADVVKKTPIANKDTGISPEDKQNDCKKKMEDAKRACAGSKLEKTSKGKTGKDLKEKITIRTGCSEKCKKAQKCILVKKSEDSTACCSPGNTGHHLVEASAFFDKGRNKDKGNPLKGCTGYDEKEAPCLCVEGTSHHTDNHGVMHTFQSWMAVQKPEGDLTLENGKKLPGVKKTTYGQAKRDGAKALVATYPESECDKDCIVAQFDEFDAKHGLNDSLEIKAVATTKDEKKLKENVEKPEVTERFEIFKKLIKELSDSEQR